MRVAVEGCCHGELDRIYSTLQRLEAKQNIKIDLLICCGDFQAVRNADDLECLACPPKYRDLRTFYQYYSGGKRAPYPTLFIGGNHEACNHLWELYYGGWVAPNIYYLGHAGVVNFGGLRIGGLSGIYQANHYKMGHFEAVPYTDSTMRSAYHVRELEVFRLAQLKQPLDIMLSHDWPHAIASHGNIQQLFRAKPHLRADIESGRLGNPPAMQLMEELKPKLWFSAHHHIKYAALVQHQLTQNPAKRQKTGSEEDPMFTKFLALDKCLPRRRFLQTLDFPDAEGPLHFSYDEEWLAVLKSTHHLLSLRKTAIPLPGMGGSRDFPSEQMLSWVKQRLGARPESSKIPEDFRQTVPAHQPGDSQRKARMPTQEVQNPQTLAFLQLLDLPYNLQHGTQGQWARGAEEAQPTAGSSRDVNPEEIELQEEGAENPEEISLDSASD